VFYRVANLPIEKVCIIKNFEEVNFSDVKRLVVTLKINPQKNNWPQKTCKPLNNKFLGSNWSVIVMRIEQIEVYDKVLGTKFCLFLTRRGTVTDISFFSGFKNYFKKKKTHHVSRLTIGYLWEEY